MRCAVKEIRTAGRNTQGVRIKKLSGNEKVVSVITNRREYPDACRTLPWNI